MQLVVHARRFFCDAPTCPRRIVVEPFPTVLAPYARQTVRLRQVLCERKTLAQIGKKLGKQALAEVATIVKPDTILAWQRKLIAQKFDGSKQQKSPGRPQTDEDLEALVVRLAQENRSQGYDRIAGALAHLGYEGPAETVRYLASDAPTA